MPETGYDHTAVERRWQERWQAAGVDRTPDDATDPTYVLGMFPYPSGKLHMGHVRTYAITDAYARFRRMCGEDVLHPMGWDAFGLPAENAAKERDTDPESWTMDCIETMRSQMDAMGLSYDWEREVTTCDPEYYRWNQWLFRQFHEAGVVSREHRDVNWCPSCETVLADEQVEGEEERCWRCETVVETRALEQWMLSITDYADELLDAIDDLAGWPDSIRGMQRNWIGRQEGTVFQFEIDGHGSVEAFTTRADTVFGATFFALAPDHPIAEALAAENDDVQRFVEQEADPDGDEPKGVRTDLVATNPVTDEKISVFVADFVLSDVGTGALMGVPAHDDRDHAFASKMDVPIEPVVAPAPAADGSGGAAAAGRLDESEVPDPPDVSDSAFTEDGVLVESGVYTGLSSDAARERITEETDGARFDKQYRLRDWLISRQRYWGTPIPVIHCDDCGPVLVPEEDLPVELPDFVNTTGNPLDAAEEWKDVDCPECGADATRETDTMDTFVDSSWYFLRYISPDADDAPFDTERANNWMPVDQYIGGIEHAVMHLLYSRFVTKAIADLDLLDHREPFTNLLAHGMVTLDGEKMSKSKGNVVSPQRIVDEYGADTARLFMMRGTRPDRDVDWSEEGVRSTNRFLGRLVETVEWFASETPDGADGPAAAYVRAETDAAIEAATESYEDLTFDTAIREATELVSTLRAYREHADAVHAETFQRGLSVALRLLAPVAPHVCEELYEALGHDDFVVTAAWPEPAESTADAARRRRLVKATREDVRSIVDVAEIEDPERIDVVVTPGWKYEAREAAMASDADDLVGDLMSDPEIRNHGTDAADYIAALDEEREALQPTLDPDEEYAALEEAAWLIAREFDAEVRVLRSGEAPAGAGDAEPGRPAIEIEE